jgi:hypothetical protein
MVILGIKFVTGMSGATSKKVLTIIMLIIEGFSTWKKSVQKLGIVKIRLSGGVGWTRDFGNCFSN